MRLTTVTVGPLSAAVATAISASQSPGAGAILINGTLASGGVATLDTPRRVSLASGGNDSGILFTVVGTDWNGQVQSNAVPGGNATTVQTTIDFKTVTAITHTGTVAGTLTIGTNGVASSRPIFLDTFAPAPTALQVDAVGTVNFTVRQSLNDPNRLTGATNTYPSPSVGIAGINWTNSPDSSVVNATASAQSSYSYSPYLVQLVLNSGTGSVTLTLNQSGTTG